MVIWLFCNQHYLDGHIQVIHWSAKDFNPLLKSFSFGETSFTPYLTNESHLKRVVMKFSSYSHFSVLNGRIHVKNVYFTLFTLWSFGDVPAHIINRPQLVWNVAAKIQSNTRSNKHINIGFHVIKIRDGNLLLLPHIPCSSGELRQNSSPLVSCPLSLSESSKIPLGRVFTVK